MWVGANSLKTQDEIGGDAGISTRDPLNPIQVRYQTAPRPDRTFKLSCGEGISQRGGRGALAPRPPPVESPCACFLSAPWHGCPAAAAAAPALLPPRPPRRGVVGTAGQGAGRASAA